MSRALARLCSYKTPNIIVVETPILNKEQELAKADLDSDNLDNLFGKVDDYFVSTFSDSKENIVSEIKKHNYFADENNKNQKKKNLQLTLFLTSRNFLRQKRRNILLVSAIAFGMEILITQILFLAALPTIC